MYSCVWLCVYVHVAGIDFTEFLDMYKRLFVLSKGVVYVHLRVVICIHVYSYMYVHVVGIDFTEFLDMYKHLFVLNKGVVYVHLRVVLCIHVYGYMYMFMLQA